MIKINNLKPCPRCGEEVTKMLKADEFVEIGCPNGCESICIEPAYGKDSDTVVDLVIDRWNYRGKRLPTELIERIGYRAYKDAFKFLEITPFDWIIDNPEKTMKFFMNDYYKIFFYSIEIAELARSFI